MLSNRRRDTRTGAVVGSGVVGGGPYWMALCFSRRAKIHVGLLQKREIHRIKTSTISKQSFTGTQNYILTSRIASFTNITLGAGKISNYKVCAGPHRLWASPWYRVCWLGSYATEDNHEFPVLSFKLSSISSSLIRLQYIYKLEKCFDSLKIETHDSLSGTFL